MILTSMAGVRISQEGRELHRKKGPASPRCQGLFLTEVCEARRTDNSWEFRKRVNQAAVIHAPGKLQHR